MRSYAHWTCRRAGPRHDHPGQARAVHRIAPECRGAQGYKPESQAHDLAAVIRSERRDHDSSNGAARDAVLVAAPVRVVGQQHVRAARHNLPTRDGGHNRVAATSRDLFHLRLAGHPSRLN